MVTSHACRAGRRARSLRASNAVGCAGDLHNDAPCREGVVLANQDFTPPAARSAGAMYVLRVYRSDSRSGTWAPLDVHLPSARCAGLRV